MKGSKNMSNETINIYTTKDQRKNIEKLKVKYQLSLTTIIDILVFVTSKMINIEKLEKIGNEYIYKKGGKTSIKTPKIFKELKWEKIKQNRFATNVLLIYINKDIGKYLETEQQKTEYYNLCNEKMTKTNDPFWNYNQHIRMQRRMLRENKEYFRKELENA